MNAACPRSLLALPALFALACQPEAPLAYESDDGPLSIEAGSPEAFGVLDLVNDPSTSFELLDLEVGLDRRAAQNIIEARPFETLEALDAVKYVGPIAVDKLLVYARAHGRIPEPSDEDRLILGVVNSEALTLALLDETIGLDARAARNIFAFRTGPDERLGTADDQRFGSVAQLDAIPWVGETALSRILAYAQQRQRPEGCAAHADCAAPLRCVGIPNDGSTPYGVCQDTRPVPGEGEACDQRTPCAEGTLCAGSTLWGEGYCVAQWMAGKASYEGPLALEGQSESAVVINGLASVPVDITLSLRLDHPRADALRVILTDPNGDSALLWERSAELLAPVARSFVNSGISRDDQVNGRWTLTIEDLDAGAPGQLLGWELFIVSRWD